MKATIGVNQEKATRIFTDREQPRDTFWKHYRKMEAEMQSGISDVCVLHYYGVGGIGKSSLLRKLEEELNETVTKPCYVRFDFSDLQDSRSVLTRMADYMVKNYGFTFPQFDIACITYARRTYADFSEREVQQFSQKSPFLRLALKTLDAVTGSVATKIFEIADDALAEYRKYLQSHKINIQKMEYIDPIQLYDNLPGYFALDMQRNLKQLKQPLVVFLDTYEKLVNELSSMGNPLLNDLWLRGEKGLIRQMPDVLWVIGGRDKLKWEKFDPDWKEALEQHLLGNLSESDSGSFLEHSGITDAELRKQLHQLTDGTPVYLDLCMDRYDAILEKGEMPTIEMFGRTPEELVERFIRYMDYAMQDFVYFLACLQQWNDTTLFAVAEGLFSPFPHTLYEKIKGLSFITDSENGLFAVHQTVEKVLLEQCSSSYRKQIGEKMTDYFSKALEEISVYDSGYGQALSYLLRAGTLQGFSREEYNQHYDRHISSNLHNLMDAGEFRQAELVFSPFFAAATSRQDDALYIAAKADQGYFLSRKGLLQKALSVDKEVLEKCKELLGETHPDTLTAMNNLATTLYHLGQHKEALSLQQEVLEKRTELLGETHPDTLTAMNNLAITLDDLGQHQKALSLQQEVVKKSKETMGETHLYTLAAMNNLAITLDDLGQHKEALSLQQEVLEKRTELLGETHLATLTAMNNLAITLGRLGQHQEALSLQQAVLKERREVLGETHPETLRAMNNLATTLYHLGRHEEAFSLQKEVLQKRIEILGEAHPDTVTATDNLIDILKKFELQEAVEKCQAAFGKIHPITIEAIYQLAYSLIQKKQYGEAEELLQPHLQICDETYGVDHSHTRDIARLYCAALMHMGQYDKAERIARKYNLLK